MKKQGNKVQIIAHRGGVIGPDAPECSLAAIRKAAEEGYDAVELDVRASSDHIPIVFHDPNLQKACGRGERAEDLTEDALTMLRYLGTEEHIASLDECLALCAARGMGVMMELKASGQVRAFYQSIKALLDKYQLRNSTIMFPPKEEMVSFFEGYSPIQQHIGKIREMHQAGMPVDQLCFIFELPWDVSREEIKEMKDLGVFTVIAINTFRYVGKYRSRNPERYIGHVKADIQRMIDWGVDALQIDSIYYQLILDNTPE